MISLYLNGQNYSPYVYGLDKFTLELSYNSDLILEYKTSSSLTFRELAYTLVKDYWWGENNYCQLGKKPIKGQIIDAGCGVEIDVEIRIGGVQICFEECEAIVTLIQVQPEEEAYLCLKNTTNFWKPNGFAEFIESRAKRFPYCQDLNVFNFLLWHFALRPIIGGLAGILCPILKIAGWDCKKFIYEIQREAAQCNNYITAALLKDIFEWNCQYCGIDFRSSILQTKPYQDVALLYMNGNIGPQIDECDNHDGKWRPLDQLNRNVLQLWDMIKPVFNSQVRMKNGIVELERKDYFDKYIKIIMDVEYEYSIKTIECPEYVHNTTELYAYGRFAYTSDGSDNRGEKNINDYNDIIEWNPNAYEEVRGEYTNTVPFAPVSFVGDKHGKWILERKSYLDGCDLDYFLQIGRAEFFVPKLVIVSEKQIKCENCRFDTAKYNPGQGFNIEMMFKNQAFPGNADTSLYDRFHKIDSPEYGRKLIELKQITWAPTNFKTALLDILSTGLDAGIKTRFGIAKPEKITINFAEKTIVINPYKIKCK